MKKKEYIGDSVYVEINSDRQIVLTTEQGDGLSSNTIYLEYEVYKALVSYVEHV